MKYMLLIYSNETSWTESEREACFEESIQVSHDLKAAGKADSDIVVYPNAGHGFHADYRSSYDEAAATDAWKRALAHFKKHGVA